MTSIFTARDVFVDTSFVLALEIANDQNHSRAAELSSAANDQGIRLVTSTFVFDEVVTFLNRRRLHSVAVRVGNALLTDRQFQMVAVDPELFHRGWQYFQRNDDKGFSLTDSISFVIMEQLGIESALAFDHHFEQAGFTIVS